MGIRIRGNQDPLLQMDLRNIVLVHLGADTASGCIRDGEQRVRGVTALADGDRIQIGTVLLTFRLSSAGVPTETPGSPDAR